MYVYIYRIHTGHRPTDSRKGEEKKIVDCTLPLNGQTKQTEQACVYVCICIY